MLSAALAREEGHVPCWLSLLGTPTSERAAAATGPSVSELEVGLALPVQRLWALPSCGSHHLPSWRRALGKLPMNGHMSIRGPLKGCGGGEGLGRQLSS